MLQGAGRAPEAVKTLTRTQLNGLIDDSQSEAWVVKRHRHEIDKLHLRLAALKIEQSEEDGQGEALR